MNKLEQAVLAGILQLPTHQEQVDALIALNVSDFESQEAKDYYALFSKVAFEKRSIINTAIIYKDAVKMPGAKIQDFIAFSSELIFSYTLADHIRELKGEAYKRLVISETETILSEIKKSFSGESLEQAKEKMIVRLSGLSLESDSKFINAKKVIEKIESNLGRENNLEGYSWGVTELDLYTSGIVTPRLIIIGGLKKTGKSRFVINTMINLYLNKVPSVFLSLEMPEYEVVKLLLSRYMQIDDMRLRSGSLMNHEERDNFKRAKKEIDWSFLNIECASRLNINQIIGRIRRYKRMFGECVIFIDYLQRIVHDRNRQAQELETISNTIADSSREYNVPIVLLSQLSNLAEREGVSIGALKGSGGIGESADVIILLENLYRKTKQESDKKKMNIFIEQRYGDSAKIEIVSDLGKSKFNDKPRT